MTPVSFLTLLATALSLTLCLLTLLVSLLFLSFLSPLLLSPLILSPSARQVDGKDVSLGIPEAVRKGMAKAAASIPLARPGQVSHFA